MSVYNAIAKAVADGSPSRCTWFSVGISTATVCSGLCFSLLPACSILLFLRIICTIAVTSMCMRVEWLLRHWAPFLRMFTFIYSVSRMPLADILLYLPPFSYSSALNLVILVITRGWPLDRVASKLTPSTQLPSICFCTLWPSDLILISGQALVMDCPCGKFGDISSTVFVLSCRQTDKMTHRITDAAKRFTAATVVSVIIKCVKWHMRSY